MNNNLNILIAGQGGREHALARALKESSSQPRLFAFPGSDGMNEVAPRLAVPQGQDLFETLKQESFDLCVVGPEQYLVEGWADRCRALNIRAWGPGADGVQLESSKAFAKDFMVRHGIPTARSTLVHSADELRNSITEYPCVLKYDGLAAGKGVSICRTEKEADDFIRRVFQEQRFGEGSVLLEQYLEGPEVSIITSVSDGAWHAFPPARDYKRLRENDQGPNTGGMGAVASRDLLSEEEHARIRKDIIIPAVEGLQKDGIPYRGFLYFGLMLTSAGPMVLEFNCRFGDPEAQAILPLVEGDLAGYLYEAANGDLQPDRIGFAEGWSVCVVMAAGRYPEASGKGETIEGLDRIGQADVFHAGTQRGIHNTFETNGGRILGVTARGTTREQAVQSVYEQVAKIEFSGAQYRGDIGRLHFEESIANKRAGQGARGKSL